MSKSRFAVNTDQLATMVPVLPKGYYAGIISACAIGNDQKCYLSVKEKMQYAKGSKEGTPTGEYVIRGFLWYQVTLTSQKAIALLQRDEPKYSAMLNLTFSDAFTLDKKGNVALANFLKILGLEAIDFNEGIDFEENPDIAIPEGLENVPNIVDMLNAIEYYKQYFNNVASFVKNAYVRAVIIQRPVAGSSNQVENIIDTGSFAQPMPGILAYKEGCENDVN